MQVLSLNYNHPKLAPFTCRCLTVTSRDEPKWFFVVINTMPQMLLIELNLNLAQNIHSIQRSLRRTTAQFKI